MTHKEQVLRLLSDGEPHSHMEGYRLGVMLHSRAADLRKDGYTVKCWHENGAYWYQLFGSVREAQGAGSAVSDGNPGSRGPSRHGPPEPSAATTPESAGADGDVGGPHSRSLPREGHQLSVWEAA